MADLLGMLNPVELAERIRGDVERNALRARNGLRMLAGSDAPHLGTTPKDVIWKRDRAELWRYRSDNRRFSPPLVIVYSLVSRSYIFDLVQGNSFVEQLLAEGFDVYMLDWGEPDERDSHNQIEDYVDVYLPAALKRACEESGSDQVNLMGYCLGATLAVLHAARDRRGLVHSLTTLAAPINFDALGVYTGLFRNRVTIDELVDDTGNIPANLMARSSLMLKPTSDINSRVNLLEKMWNDEFVHAYRAMTYWNSDHVPFPGGVARQAAETLIEHNALVNRRMRLGGELVDLTAIRSPVLAVLAERDHIVPLPAATPLRELIGSERVEELRLQAGHVGLFVGKSAARGSIPQIIDFLHRHSRPLDVRASTHLRSVPDTPQEA